MNQALLPQGSAFSRCGTPCMVGGDYAQVPSEERGSREVKACDSPPPRNTCPEGNTAYQLVIFLQFS